MEVAKKFVISEWDESAKQRLLSFWQDRKIKFLKIEENEFSGKRGSFLGNCFSFNMINLMTELTIVKDEQDVITCTLKIDTSMQIITDWNKEYWELEIKTFESVLVRNNFREHKWKEFNKRSKKSDLMLVLKIILLSLAFGLILVIFDIT